MKKIVSSPLLSILCLVLLAGCGTGSSPTDTKTALPHGCQAGTGHILKPTTSPVTADWPMFHGNLKRDGLAIITGSSKLTEAWSYCTGASILSSPVVQDGIVYIGSTSGTLTALEAQTGKVHWTFKAGGGLFSTPTINNGTVYVGGIDGFLYAVDATTGRLQWKSSADGTGAKIWSSPAFVHGLAIFGVASALSEKPKVAGEVLALDATTGKRIWRAWVLPGGSPGGGVWSSPAIDEARGIVYVGTGDPDDGVQALSLEDGHLIWHWRSVAQDTGDTDVGSGPMLYTDVTGKERVVVGGKNGVVYTLDAESGKELWQTPIVRGRGIFGTATYAHGIIYIPGVQLRSSVLVALDAATGKIIWQHPIPYIVYGSPALTRTTLYLGVGDGFSLNGGGIEVIDAQSGKLLQFVDLHSAATSSVAVLPGWLFVGTQDGNLYAFIR